MSVVYINSTLPAAQALNPADEVSPIHYWGYRPRQGDRVYAHALTRPWVSLRARLAGLDLPLLARTVGSLAGGCTGVYAVSQPDLLPALCGLRRLFPRARLVTWAWTRPEVQRFASSYRACDLVLCLTEDARDEALQAGGIAAVLGPWGADPEFYQGQSEPRIYEVSIIGVSARDAGVARRAAAATSRSIAVPKMVRERLQIPAGPRIIEVQFSAAREIAASLRRTRVTWIPLLPGDYYPTGYTNLIEALLCGCAVVIADCSRIPSAVLKLPGVYRYQTGSAESLLAQTEQALEDCASAEMAQKIQTHAANSLNGVKLQKMIREALALPS